MHRSATIDIIDPSGDAQDPQPRRGWTRWLRFLLVVLVLGGFGALVAYVYYGMIRDALPPDGQIPLVRADPTPFRSRPENPGGVEIPHQNFEVYDRLGQPVPQPQTGPGGRPVERLLPPPETPMPRPAAAPPPPPPAPVASAPPAPAPPAPASAMPPPAAPAVPAAAPPAAVAQGPAAPSQVASAPPQPVAGGTVRIQIGALPTQEAAAREAERLRRSYGNIFGRVGITVVRGESAGNPIYRVQAGPVRDRAAADELCNALRQHRVGCIIVAR